METIPSIDPLDKERLTISHKEDKRISVAGICICCKNMSCCKFIESICIYIEGMKDREKNPVDMEICIYSCKSYASEDISLCMEDTSEYRKCCRCVD